MHGTCRTVGWGELASKAAARWLVARLILGLITTIGNTPCVISKGEPTASLTRRPGPYFASHSMQRSVSGGLDNRLAVLLVDVAIYHKTPRDETHA